MSKCNSKKGPFARCDLDRHKGTTHAVHIGGVRWFAYRTNRGKYNPIGYVPTGPNGPVIPEQYTNPAG